MEKDRPKFNEGIIKSYKNNSNKGYIFEEDVKYSITLHNLHNELHIY